MTPPEYEITFNVMESDLCLNFVCPACEADQHVDTNEETVVVCGSCGAKFEIGNTLTLTPTTNPDDYREATAMTDEQVRVSYQPQAWGNMPTDGLMSAMNQIATSFTPFRTFEEYDAAIRERAAKQMTD